MDLDKLVSWLQQQIAECEPTDGMGAPEVSERLPKLLRARRDTPNGYAFGFTFPDDVKAQVPDKVLPTLDAAIERWGAWLAKNRGDQGTAFFEKAKATYGVPEGSG